MKKLTKYEALTAALDRARLAALEFSSVPDCGTCNFDSPALDFSACGMTCPKAEQAIQAAGLRSYVWKVFGHRLLVICGFQQGQGNRRTDMAEAFCASLKAEGYPCMMYYQID